MHSHEYYLLAVAITCTCLTLNGIHFAIVFISHILFDVFIDTWRTVHIMLAKLFDDHYYVVMTHLLMKYK